MEAADVVNCGRWTVFGNVFYCNQWFFKTSSKAERTRLTAAAAVRSIVCHSNIIGVAYTQNALQSVNHEDRNTSEQDSAVAGPSCRFEAHFHVVQSDLHPRSCGFMPKNRSSMSHVEGRSVPLGQSIIMFPSLQRRKESCAHALRHTHFCTHIHSHLPSTRIRRISDAVCLACSTAEQC